MAVSPAYYAVFHFNWRRSGWSERHFLKATNPIEAKRLAELLGRWRIAACADETVLIWARLSDTDTPWISQPLQCIGLRSSRYSGSFRDGVHTLHFRLHYRYETADGKWSNRLFAAIPDAVFQGTMPMSELQPFEPGADLPNIEDPHSHWFDIFRAMTAFVRDNTVHVRQLPGADPPDQLVTPWAKAIYRQPTKRDVGRDWHRVSWEPMSADMEVLPTTGNPLIFPAFGPCGLAVGAVRSAYARPCRWYPAGGVGVIRYFIVPERHGFLDLPTVFWPYTQDFSLRNTTRSGELTNPYKWNRGIRHRGLDLMSHGTAADFLGQGLPAFDPTIATPVIWIVRCGVACEILTLTLEEDSLSLPVEEADIVRLVATEPVDVHGIAEGEQCRRLLLWNVGTEHAITFIHDSDEAENIDKMWIPGGEDFTLAPQCAVELWFDHVDARWRVESPISPMTPTPGVDVWKSEPFDIAYLQADNVINLHFDAASGVTAIGGFVPGTGTEFPAALVYLRPASVDQSGMVNLTAGQHLGMGRKVVTSLQLDGGSASAKPQLIDESKTFMGDCVVAKNSGNSDYVGMIMKSLTFSPSTSQVSWIIADGYGSPSGDGVSTLFFSWADGGVMYTGAFFSNEDWDASAMVTMFETGGYFPTDIWTSGRFVAQTAFAIGVSRETALEGKSGGIFGATVTGGIITEFVDSEMDGGTF